MPHRIREKLNLKTNEDLKGDNIYRLSNEELLALYRSARRSQASAGTGIVGGGLISIGNPAFLGGVAVSGWQGTVATINKHRIKEDFERRFPDPETRRVIEEQLDSKAIKDILTGVAFKTVVGGITLGIAGADTAFDNAIALVGDQGHAVAAAAIDPSIATSGVGADGAVPQGGSGSSAAAAAGAQAGNAASSTAGAATDVPHPHADHFQHAHPDGSAADHVAHNFTNGIGDAGADIIGAATGHGITTDSSWLHLDQLHDVQGVGGAALAAETGIVGAQAELSQVPQMAAEVALDEKLKRRQMLQGGKLSSTSRVGEVGEKGIVEKELELECSQCTFRNKAVERTCEMCGAVLVRSSLPGSWDGYPFL